MARIHRKGGGPVKAKKAHGKSKKRRRDLEDLYHQAVADEKAGRKRQKLEKKQARGETNDDAPTAQAEQPLPPAPVQTRDLSTLLSLLSDEDSAGGQSATEDDTLDGVASSDFEAAATIDPAQPEIGDKDDMHLAPRDTDEDAEEEAQEDAEEDGSVEAESEGDHLSIAPSEDDAMSRSEHGVLCFESFDRPIPSPPCETADATCDPYRGVVTPAAEFCPFLHGGKGAVVQRRDVEQLLRSPVELVSLGSRPPNVPRRVWKNWVTHGAPSLAEQEASWRELAASKDDGSKPPYFSTSEAGVVWKAFSSYMDILATHEFYGNTRSLRGLAILHAVTHLYRTRQLLAQHNLTLKTLVQQDTAGDLDPLGEDSLRDQGFARARVLILVPTKAIARDCVQTLLRLWPNCKQVRLRKRFDREFGPGEDDPSEAGSDLLDADKPVDYADLFRGNTGDHFRLGIKFHGAGVSLYAPFDDADLILASPLGLRLVVGHEGAERRDYDFLSSIELAIVDRCDVLKMQNWENVRDILATLNLKPASLPKSCDIRRLRLVFSEGLAQQYRQTIVLSNGRRPELNALFPLATPDTICKNFRGLIQLHRAYLGTPAKEGALRVAKQLFMFVPCDDPTQIYDALLAFVGSQFPQLFLSIGRSDRILLVVPSHVEYLRLRKVLKNSRLTHNDPRCLSRFRTCHEHSSNRMLTTSRQMFRNGDVKLLLTTERFLFYRRYYLRGADHVVFFGPPEYPELYAHCLKMVNSPATAISVVYFTRFHGLQCERLVGTPQAKKLVQTTSTVPKVFVLN